MTVETYPLEDSVSATVSPATEGLPDDWTCDIDGSRLNSTEALGVAGLTYDVRVCSVDPGHRKLIPG